MNVPPPSSLVASRKMSGEPQPFSINCSVVAFEGGFISLSMNDRGLGRALGLDMKKKSPFAGTTCIQHLAKLRSKKIDELIFKQQLKDDPQDDTNASSAKIDTDRVKAFEAANIPKTIEIHVASFTATDECVVPQRLVKVLAAPRRDALLWMQLTEDNLAWLRKAIRAKWGVEGAPLLRTNRKISEYPKLSRPDIMRYKCTRDSKVAIRCSYRTHQGELKYHQRSLGMTDHMTEGMLQAHVASTELLLVLEDGVF